MKALTRQQALEAMGSNTHIHVRTRSGAAYRVERDVIECATDGSVYGYRTNGKMRCVFKRGSRDTVNDCRWFYLRNVKLWY